MKQRILATNILWITVIGLAWFLGKWGGFILIASFGIGAFYELTNLLKLAGRPVDQRIGMAAFSSLLIALILCPPWYVPPFALLMFGLSMALVACLFTTSVGSFSSVAVPTLGAVSLMLLPFASITLITHESGMVLTIWVVAVTKFGDVGALLTGMWLGKHKMAPAFSPKKTWEGFAGGIVASMLIGFVIIIFFGEWLPAGLTPIHGVWSAAFISAAGVLGDLMESAFKREAQVKDSGNTIPGIGGFLDLTDSMTLAFPVAYFLTWLIF